MLKQALLQVRQELQDLAPLGPRVYDGRYQSLVQEEHGIKNQLNKTEAIQAAEQNDSWGNGR
jgi:hypothetical protein